MPNGTLEHSFNYYFLVKEFLVWDSWDLTRRFPSPSRIQMLSPKIIFLCSMKNSSHVMKDLKMNNKFKVCVFDMVEEIVNFSLRWLRRGS